MPSAPHDIYAESRSSLIGVLRSLDAEQSRTAVEGCPGWTVKDVAAHLSGLVAETLAGVPPPRGSAEATARQVGDRSELTLDEVCEEWESNASALADYAVGDPDYVKLLACDLTVHTHDIAEALDRPIDGASAGTILAAEHYLPLLQDRVADHLDIALEVELDGIANNPARGGTTPLKLSAQPLEFLRSVTGRRTRSQVAALDWSGDPGAVLDVFSQYGPLAD